MTFHSEQQTLFLLIYGFLAWAVEVIFYAVKEKAFINRGFLTLPIDFEIGLVFSGLAVALPPLGRNYGAMYVITLASLILVRAVLGFFGGRLSKNAKWLESAPGGTWRSLLGNALLAAAILIAYLLLQPVLMVLAAMIPRIVLQVIQIVAWVLILADFVAVVYAMRKGRDSFQRQMEKGQTDELSARIGRAVWRRLEKAYPGIRDKQTRSGVVFAKGMSLDKLI